MICPRRLAANLRKTADIRRDCLIRYPDTKYSGSYFTAALILDSIALALDPTGDRNAPEHFVDLENGRTIK